MIQLTETCRIVPQDPVEECRLPLTSFDIKWLRFTRVHRLLFYRLPSSKEHFLDTFLPKIKQSLSLALKYYFPLAGTLACPSNINIDPVLRYVPGDSVSLTVFESDADFDTLVGYHARDADQFYEFVPQLPSPLEEPDWKLFSVLAVQVTMFPGSGMCIGIANEHVVGDGTSMVGFINFWADMCKHGGDEEFLITEAKSLPVFDKSLVTDPPGAYSYYWNTIMKQIPVNPKPFPLPTNKIRATYILGVPEIEKLKNLLIARKPGLFHISSFVVTMAYVWTCLAKSIVAAGEYKEVEDDDFAQDSFFFPVDARARLDPPVPRNYFGNCIASALVKIRHRDIIGDAGFFATAKGISMEIENRVNSKGKLAEGMMNLEAEIVATMGKQMLMVTGTARLDIYGADFGWGKVAKVEVPTIDEFDGKTHLISLCRAKESDGGLEVGLSLSCVVMTAFATTFADGVTMD